MAEPPKQIGPYEILGLLGEGGMGTVYRARDPRLDRIVALKVLRQDGAGDADRQARFIQEAKSVSALNHPNIVTVHDMGVHDGMAYMVMELIEGQSLDQLITPRGMRISEVLRIASQVADAFAEAHAARIVHRDLKPANVMVQPNGRVKVLDFGLAKLLQESAPQPGMVTQTAAGIVVGTAAYMSPEQAEARPLDARSDIFSFGAVLYEMCSGRRAFQGDSNASVLADVLREEPRPLRDLRDDLPSELARLVMRCLRKDPARRVQSMADLKVAFDELRDEIDSGRTAVAPAAARAVSRWSWPSAVAGAALAAVAVSAVFLIGMPKRSAATDDAPLEPLPLTTYPGRERFPALSPDGNSVAFSWNGEHLDNFDIYVQLIGAGAPLRLTTDPADDGPEAWSPDGRFLAFFRRIDHDRVALMMVPTLGGVERKVAEFSVRLQFDNPLADLLWTPDGNYIIASGGRSPGDAADIHRIAIDTGEITTLIKAPAGKEGYSPLALSPDGHTLAAFLNFPTDGKGTQLFHMTPSWEIAGAPTAAPIPTDVQTLAWTPDSRELVYRIGVNVPLPLYRVRLPDGAPVAMPWVGADASGATMSAVKKRMAFSRIVRDANIWRLAIDSAERGTPSVDQIAGSSFRDVFAQYSPDGKRLVFYSNRGGSIQIWTANADGTAPSQLTNLDPTATTGSPRWSPDGRRIVFDSSAGGHYRVYEIDPGGGPAHPLTPETVDSFTGVYSPDGTSLYFTSSRSGRTEVWRQPVAGGPAEQVTKNGGNGPAISPDGATVYYAKDDGSAALWRMPVGGGPETRVADNLYRYSFAVTASAIYFITQPEKTRMAVIKKIDLATRRTSDLFTLDRPPDLGLGVSPDGRYLLFSKLDYSGADLMLVENFR